MHGCLGRETPLREGPSCCTVTVPLPSDDQAPHSRMAPASQGKHPPWKAPRLHQFTSCVQRTLIPVLAQTGWDWGSAGFMYRDGMDERVKGHKPGEQGLEPEDLVGLQHFSSLQEEPGSNPASLGLPKPRARIKFAVRV